MYVHTYIITCVVVRLHPIPFEDYPTRYVSAKDDFLVKYLSMDLSMTDWFKPLDFTFPLGDQAQSIVSAQNHSL